MTDDKKDKKDGDTTPYYNSTDSQIVVNNKGTIVSGGEWAELEDTPQVRRAVESGDLVEVESMPEEVGHTAGPQGDGEPISLTEEEKPSQKGVEAPGSEKVNVKSGTNK